MDPVIGAVTAGSPLEICIPPSIHLDQMGMDMRTRFTEFYPRTEAEIGSLWSGGMLAVDANVLLGLYEYPDSALDDILRVFSTFSDRLWLPYQVGVEYHRNRLKALPQPKHTLDRVSKSLVELRDKSDRLGFPEYHPTLDLVEAERLRQAIVAALDALDAHLKSSLSSLPTTEYAIDGPDLVRDRVEAAFDTRIGAAPSASDLEKLRKEADVRFAKRVPPGYKDSEKDSDSRYGDYLIWRALLSELRARTTLSGLIFVTNDRKEDWWLRKDSQMLGVRPELIRECLDETGRLIHLYTPGEFLRASQGFLSVAVSPTTVAAAERISQRSDVRTLLRSLRMELPDVKTRIELLRRVFEALEGGQITVADDLNDVIDTIQENADNTYVSTPLFFSLINEAYGPLRVDSDGDRRLRERHVRLGASIRDAAAFIRVGHVAWLAQALYRLRRGGFGRQELADDFFGLDAGSEALQLIEEAERAMEQDVLLRGQ